jgi:Flp pilus assembly protein TadG
MRPQMICRVAGSERGSILVHVAVSLVGLMAFTTFVADYGVMWTGRRMAQNSADSAALAGAVSLAFDDYDDRTDTGPAKQAAFRLSQQNEVWGESPNVNITTDITFPPCPDDGTDACIRVDVYRNQARNNPLPVFFGALVGLQEQGVRATATAKVSAANGSNCLKPLAVPDKWIDNNDTTAPIDNQWTPDDTFETDVATPDYYERPMPGSPGTPGTGFTVENDYGVQLTLKHSNPQDAIAPGIFFPVVLTDPGANTYREHLGGCPGNDVRINDGSGCPGGLVDPTKGCLDKEPGNMVGPTNQGFSDLYNQDPNARWVIGADGKGNVSGGCEAAGNCNSTTGLSPRRVPIAVFDTAAYYQSKLSGRADPLVIVNILGFFVDAIQGNGQNIRIIGYLVPLPGEWEGGPTNSSNTFLYTIALVR